jgi:hypothetical protein
MLVSALSLQQWSDIAEIVAGVGVTLVAVQVWLGVRNSRVELITGMTTLITQVDQAFIDHPHLWRYFRDTTQPPPKGETEGDRVRAIALTMANVLDHVVGHMRKMGWRTRGAWRLYIYDVHMASPVLKEVLNENADWWPGLREQIAHGDPRTRSRFSRRFF